MDPKNKVLTQLADGNTILVTLKKDCFSVTVRNLSLKLKAIFSHFNDITHYDKIWMDILSPFKSNEMVCIKVDELLSIKIIDAGIFYTRIRKDVYQTECRGHRITITKNRETNKWGYKIESQVSCSWRLYKSKSNIETLEKAKELVIRMYSIMFKAPKVKPGRAYCQG